MKNFEFRLHDYYSSEEKVVAADSLAEAERIALQSQEMFTWSILKDVFIQITYKGVIVSNVHYFSDNPIRRQDSFIDMNDLHEIL